MPFGSRLIRSILMGMLVHLGGCGLRSTVRPVESGPPPVAEFFTRVAVDPVGAAPLALVIVRSSIVDETTRRRVVERWSREVPRLEVLRDARLADAEALLAQGALGAATEAINEAAALEGAVGLPGRPRAVAQLARDVEWARLAAEQTAREAGERARGAYRSGRFEDALSAASEARQLRARASLPVDVALAVLEGLSSRAIPPPPTPVHAVAIPERPPPTVVRPPRRTLPVATAVRRAAPDAAEPAAPTGPAADPLAALRHAWHADDLPGALRALEQARAAGVAEPGLTALAERIEARRDAVIQSALDAAAAAYAREDLESARAHWERVLALMPGEPTATEGLTLYRRFLALQPGVGR
jgi:tetratricopeptide (TPR) repeat protein